MSRATQNRTDLFARQSLTCHCQLTRCFVLAGGARSHYFLTHSHTRPAAVRFYNYMMMMMMMESPDGATYELETYTDDWIIVGGACALSDPTLSSSRTVGHWHR